MTLLPPADTTDATSSPEAMARQLAALEREVAALRAEVALYHAEQHEPSLSARIVAAAPVLMYVFDLAENRLLYTTQNVFALLGHTIDEMQSMDMALFAELLHPDDREAFLANLSGLVGASDGEILEVTYRVRHADGSWRWMLSQEVVFARASNGAVRQKLGIIKDITAHKQADANLELFRAVVENALDGISIADANTIMHYANPAFRAMTGLGDRTVGTSHRELYDPEALAQIAAEVRPAMRAHGRWQGQLPARRPDGTEWIAQMSCFIMNDPAEQTPQWVAIFRDATAEVAAARERERLAADLARQANELRTFNALIEQTADGVMLCDAEGRITYLNPAACALYRTSDATELLGTGASSLIVADEWPRFEAEIGPSLRQHGSWRGRIWHVRPDGSRMAVACTSFYMNEADGKPLALASLLRDVTAEDAAEQALRASEERMRMVLENLPAVIAIVNKEGRFTLSTGKALQSLGLKPSEAAGHSAFEMYKDFPEVVADLERGLTGDTFDVTRTIDGATFETRYLPLYDAQGGFTSTMVVSADITDRIRGEQERARLQEELIQAQQAALRELSTPLIPITDDVVVMPLIGSIDSGRAQQVIETLLAGVAEQRAHTAIVDITGVPVVDTQVANALIRAAQAVKLLGARVILTGIRPEVAQTLVGLGADLSGIVTRGTLQDGIAYAL